MKKLLSLLLLLLFVGTTFVLAAEQWQTGRPTPNPKYASSWQSWIAAQGKCNMGLLVKNLYGETVCIRYRHAGNGLPRVPVDYGAFGNFTNSTNTTI